MATGGGDGSLGWILKEFEAWQEAATDAQIYLLQSNCEENGGFGLNMLLAGEYQFKLQCPPGYPEHTEHFYIPDADSSVKLWANALNEFLLDSPEKLTLTQILNKATSLHWNDHRESPGNSEDENMEEEEDEIEEIPALSEDEFFTTEWELNVARQKKRWAQKEQEMREQLKKIKTGPTTSEYANFHVSGAEKDQAKQIFTSSAASGILTNDLVKILQDEKVVGFTADPIDDNIYQWCVKMFNFLPGSELSQDLSALEENFGYNWIELQLDFAIDLYPFYPPLVKVVRPRLQGSMMQRVTNMEMLKLSYWNPAKDMRSILVDIKQFLQQWARIEATSERNDRRRYPYGSYVDIEHHLLRLALVSEVNPRANFRYHIDVERPPDMRSYSSQRSLATSNACSMGNHDEHFYHKDHKRREEYWAAGVGYGHHNRPEWDIRAFVAAQREKDKQIESVLHKILHELKVLYARHAPQLKPRKASTGKSNSSSSSASSSAASSCGNSSSNSSSEQLSSEPMTSALPPTSGDGCNGGYLVAVASSSSATAVATSLSSASDIVDPVTDMYNILEGSALVPFAEQYLKTDSFLEICRHTSVYRVIVDIIKEIALQPQLVPLLGRLVDQQDSVYQLLANLEQKANVLLHHICKAGNGCIPKPPKKEGVVTAKRSKERLTSSTEHSVTLNTDSHGAATAEEKLAREFQVLFKDVSEAFRRLNVDPNRSPCVSTSVSASVVMPMNGGDQHLTSTTVHTEVMDICITTTELDVDAKYKMVMSELQFLPMSIDVDVPNSHHFMKLFKKQEPLSQAQIFRIAQELTSLAISLPLNLSSAIFVRTDDDKITLMKALIAGPEDTPYSCGCFHFDIFFPTGYPKIPPMVNLQTTGSGTVRFNPNLYNCGKVCLSLLGTWDGQQGEQWNETTSTILQVLVSIQSLILVPEPYFNEPGYEQEIGTEAGEKHSAEYNLDIRINTIKHAMIGQLQNPSQGFEDVIKAHFYLKKERILQEVEQWSKAGKSSKLDRAIQNLRSELQKLEPPAKLVNALNAPTRNTATIVEQTMAT